MKGKYLRKIGGLALSALMVFGVAALSSSETQAQGRRRIVIVRPYPYRIYRPFGFGYRSWWGYPYGWGYGPWGYGAYGHYVFDNSEEAVTQAYKDGFKTGRDDGKKDKSFDPQRSHYFKEAGFGNFADVYRPNFSRGYQDGYSAGQDERSAKRAG
jgi:hypothetical protein